MTTARAWTGPGPCEPALSQELDFLQEGNRLGTGSEFGDVDPVRLELSERRLGLRRANAGGDRVLEADRVGDYLLAGF